MQQSEIIFEYLGKSVTQISILKDGYYIFQYKCENKVYDSIYALELEICPKTKARQLRMDKKRSKKRRQKKKVHTI